LKNVKIVYNKNYAILPLDDILYIILMMQQIEPDLF